MSCGKIQPRSEMSCLTELYDLMRMIDAQVEILNGSETITQCTKILSKCYIELVDLEMEMDDA